MELELFVVYPLSADPLLLVSAELFSQAPAVGQNTNYRLGPERLTVCCLGCN